MDRMLPQAFLRRVLVEARRGMEPRRPAKPLMLRDFHYTPDQGNVFEWILDRAQKVREQNDRLR